MLVCFHGEIRVIPWEAWESRESRPFSRLAAAPTATSQATAPVVPLFPANFRVDSRGEEGARVADPLSAITPYRTIARPEAAGRG